MFSSALAGYCLNTQDTDTLFQLSTINALMDGIYDGEMTYKEVKQKGDFGIGTFNALDGEMVAVNGGFYQITSDGAVHSVSPSMKTPFAAVTFFNADQTVSIAEPSSLDQLKSLIDPRLPTKNVFYAIKIEGLFSRIKLRSVPKQEKPYPPLADVIKTQPTFEYQNIKGTIVGLYCPQYAEGINVPGYHFHFISADRTKGGHVLECETRNGTISIDDTTGLHVVLLKTDAFYTWQPATKQKDAAAYFQTSSAQREKK